jgi:hypothetical protein
MNSQSTAAEIKNYIRSGKVEGRMTVSKLNAALKASNYYEEHKVVATGTGASRKISVVAVDNASYREAIGRCVWPDTVIFSESSISDLLRKHECFWATAIS